MNPPNPLDQLKDIHLPEAISWWPPAPGWWLLAVLLIAVIVSLVCQLRKRRLNRHYRQQAQRQLAQLKADFERHSNQQQYAQQLVTLLRQLVKTAYPNQQLEALPISDLIRTLREQSQDACFSRQEQDNQQLDTLLYSPNIDESETQYKALLDQFEASLNQWINKHRMSR